METMHRYLRLSSFLLPEAERPEQRKALLRKGAINELVRSVPSPRYCGLSLAAHIRMSSLIRIRVLFNRIRFMRNASTQARQVCQQSLLLFAVSTCCLSIVSQPVVAAKSPPRPMTQNARSTPQHALNFIPPLNF